MMETITTDRVQFVHWDGKINIKIKMTVPIGSRAPHVGNHRFDITVNVH